MAALPLALPRGVMARILAPQHFLSSRSAFARPAKYFGSLRFQGTNETLVGFA